MVVRTKAMRELLPGGTCSYVVIAGADDGLVYVRGETFYHELDEDSAVQARQTFTPVPVHCESRFRAGCLACGLNFFIVVTEGGEVFCAGHRARLGLGVGEDTAPGLSRIDFSSTGCKSKLVGAAAGESHALVMSSAGEVFTFGSNALGQVGFKTPQNSLT